MFEILIPCAERKHVLHSVGDSTLANLHTSSREQQEISLSFGALDENGEGKR